MTKTIDVMIIGAGPAGIAAAIYLRRAGADFVIFEGGQAGGLLRNAHLVENYPGFPGGISGPELAGRMVRQAEELGVEITQKKIEHLSFGNETFKASSDSNEYEAEIAVIASGTVPSSPESIQISPEVSERIFYEVTDAAGIEGKKFAVIGGGDAAFDYALSLAERNRVAIFVRSGIPRCLDLLLERCEENENISIYIEAEIFEICAGTDEIILVGEGGGEAGMSIEADYAMIATGRTPCLDFVDNALIEQFDLLSGRGKLYLVGDVVAGRDRQASIATGGGVAAAMKILEHLEERHR